ncbi:MAG: DUF2520 domain-containing protein [Thermaurantimonas sp.]
MIDRKHLIVGTGHGARFVLKLLGCLPEVHSADIASRNPKCTSYLARLYPEIDIIDVKEVSGTYHSVWLAVPDSCISYYASSLQVRAERWIHLSGASEISLLNPHQEQGVVVWPVISLAAPYSIKEIPIVIESAQEDSFVQLIIQTFPKSIHLAYKERLTAHMAAVVANNFVQYLYEVLEEELKENTIQRELILPIISQTFSRIMDGQLSGSLTGPARRGDSATIEKHLIAIQSEHLMKVYEAITNCIREYYGKKL